MSGKDAVILFGHGARDPEWARPLQRTREQLLSLSPGLQVELAFLELMRPTLAEAIDDVIARGASRVVVVPMFIAQGGHVKSDVPVLITAARARHPACEVRLALPVGEDDSVIAAMAAYAGRCLD
ncbi:sirohydrochlorin chelatase [Azoarcus sp. KH32C]|uniref:sirohydrochlorin chelatase n=1 Tax=Azoarcus sp. KH32C TaxID=748247 RepID=UPI00023861BD|nr:CbiX/SirB N-terminal domain-containing protein [Azoarcus sp. KH32C]BAL26225.1 sirohydrochlorin cobaltochelatase, cobalamin (vitamin B12) biosynthesis CbiX protein [Azoarcus sp. KH32C]